MSFAEIPLRFLLLKTESNFHNHLRWLSYLAGEEFATDWEHSLQTGGNMQKMIAEARAIVEEDIYAYNTTSGTGRIKESITGFFGEGDDYRPGPTAYVYSDPSVAPSKGPFESGGDPSRFSYAAFFEDPEFNSFIPPREEPFDSRRYRPFFGHMTESQHRLNAELSRRALFVNIRKHMPKIQS